MPEDNLVIPQIFSGTAANPFSIGTTATDSEGRSVSLYDTINTVQQPNSATFISLLSTNHTVSLSSLINNYYKLFSMGDRLNLAGSNYDLPVSSLIDAQVLSFQIEVHPETHTQYFNKKDGRIFLKLNYQTCQRYVNSTPGHILNNWAGARNSTGTDAGSYTVSIYETNESYTFNSYFQSATATYLGYPAVYFQVNQKPMVKGKYTVTVIDNNSGFWLSTVVNCALASPINYYDRAPGLIRLNGGSWTKDTVQYPAPAS